MGSFPDALSLSAHLPRRSGPSAHLAIWPSAHLAICLVFCLLAFAASARGAATPAFVQANGAYNVAGSTGVAFTSNVTNGHVIYAALYDGNAASDTLAFTDTMGNTFKVLTSSGMASSGYTVNAATDGDTLAIGCAAVTAATGADTVKFTIGGSGTALGALIVYEVSGSTCTLDTTSSPSGGFTTSDTTFTSPVTSGSITTTTNNDLMLFYVGNVHDHNGSSPLQMSVSSPFSNLACETYGSGFTCTPATGDSNHGVMIAVTMQVLATGGSSSGSITVTNPGAAMEYALAYAAFKPANNAYTATPSETNTASDSLARLETLARGMSETNTGSDSAPVRTYAAQRAPSETNTASDTLTRLASWLRANNESNTASDSLSASYSHSGTHAYNATPSETNTASDALSRLSAYLRTDSETNTASDQGISRLAALVRTAAETNTAADALTRTATFWRGNVIVLSWLPPPGAGGNSSYTYNVYRSTTEDAEGPSNPSTLIASGIDAGCSTQANCTYLDYSIQTGTEYYYEVTAVYQGSESLVSNESGIVAAPNVVLEADSTSDSLGRLAGFSRADSETNTASDALARLGHFGRGDSETNIASDLLSALKPTGNVYNAVMNEALSVSDALSRLSAYLRGDSETNTTSDALSRLSAYLRGDSETNTTSDALSRLSAYVRRNSETNTTGDALGRLAASYRQAAETAAFSDVVAGIWTRSLGIPVQPRHAGTVPGKTKTGEAPVH